MGKTQHLIDMLIACIDEGQPKSVVVAATYEHLQFMMERVRTTLELRGQDYTVCRKRKAILVDGSEIEFTSAGDIDIWRCGHRGYGEFWDEYTEYVYDRIQAGKGGYNIPE